MDSIPLEIIKEILNNLDISDIFHVYRLGVKFHSLINNEHFWSNRIKTINIDRIPIKWQEFAITNLDFRKIPIYNELSHDQNIIKNIWMNPEQSEQSIITNLYKILKYNEYDDHPDISFWQNEKCLFSMFFCSGGYRKQHTPHSIHNTTRIIIDDMPALVPASNPVTYPIYVYFSYV